MLLHHWDDGLRSQAASVSLAPEIHQFAERAAHVLRVRREALALPMGKLLRGERLQASSGLRRGLGGPVAPDAGRVTEAEPPGAALLVDGGHPSFPFESCLTWQPRR